MNLDDYGSSDVFKWTHDYLYNYLTTGKHKLLRQPLLKNAFSQVLREDFIPDEVKDYSYEDKELDIGYGEVINKPTEVARMLSLLVPRMGGRYLDIGTGSGWTAALLGMCAGEEGQVYTLERMQFLVDIARINLAKYPLIKNVHVIFRDGIDGMPDYAPFDGIHVAAAFEEIPEKLAWQLKIGGKMVVPNTKRELKVLERTSEEEFNEITYGGFLFTEIKQGVE